MRIGTQIIILHLTMNTCLIVCAMIAFLGFAWAEQKSEFSTEMTACREDNYKIVEWCDSFKNPALCAIKCRLTPALIFYYCTGRNIVNENECLDRFLLPYSPKDLNCPTLSEEIWKYCDRFREWQTCKMECNRWLQKEEEKVAYYVENL